MIRVVIAEDHALVRLGLRMVLASSGRYRVVAETDRGVGLEAIAVEHDAQLVLLDLALSDCSGLDVAKRVKEALPQVRILIVTGNAFPGSVSNAFAAGADGFLIKHAQGAELMEAIEAVMSGRRYISSRLGGLGAPAEIEADSERKLTTREKQIVKMIARGSSNLEIANALHISVLTARKHRQNVMLKLDLHNGAEITAYAIQSGLMEAPEIQG